MITGNHKKVFGLTKEMCSNNREVANLLNKIKGIKDTIKAIGERNEAIMDELNVHTEDEDLYQSEG